MKGMVTGGAGECKSELIALCEQYCGEEDWQPHVDVLYKMAHKPVRRKVEHPFGNIGGVEEISIGEKFNNEGPPMGNWSLLYSQESPRIIDGLPCECQLIAFNSFCFPL